MGGRPRKFSTGCLDELRLFAEHQFYLDRVLADGTTERANLISAAEQGRSSAAVRLAGEPLPPDAEHVWRWFQELDQARGSNGFGANPISYQDVLAWVQLTGTITRPSEVAAIMMLDRMWLIEQARQASANRPKPPKAKR